MIASTCTQQDAKLIGLEASKWLCAYYLAQRHEAEAVACQETAAVAVYRLCDTVQWDTSQTCIQL